MFVRVGNKLTQWRSLVVSAVVMCTMMTVWTISYTEPVKFIFQQAISHFVEESLPVGLSSIQIYLKTDFVSTVNKNGSSDGQCSRHFDKNPVDVLAKIEGLKFPGVQQNMTSLFQPMTIDPVPPELPVFVTAFSSNHYAEGSYMLKHVNNVVRARYKNLKIIVFDLGLTEKHNKENVKRTMLFFDVSAITYHYIRASCHCEMRQFHFHLYPTHIRNLKNYAWKPIIIQTVAKEHPLLFWLDASIRFKTGNLDGLIADAKKQGLMVYGAAPYQVGRRSIAHVTLKETFVFLNEPPCAYGNVTGAIAGFIVIFANQLITKYVLYPWVACALSFGCMEPLKNSQRFLYCPLNTPQHKYHLCHRYDMSVLGILHRLLFHRELKKHAIDRKYFMVCRFPGITVKCDFY